MFNTEHSTAATCFDIKVQVSPPHICTGTAVQCKTCSVEGSYKALEVQTLLPVICSSCIPQATKRVSLKLKCAIRPWCMAWQYPPQMSPLQPTWWLLPAEMATYVSGTWKRQEPSLLTVPCMVHFAIV